MPSQEMNKPLLSVVLQSVQLIVLVIGVGGLFLAIGRRDATLDMNGAQISELRSICSDLAKITGQLSISDGSQIARLEAIDQRLTRLETRRQ